MSGERSAEPVPGARAVLDRLRSRRVRKAVPPGRLLDEAAEMIERLLAAGTPTGERLDAERLRALEKQWRENATLIEGVDLSAADMERACADDLRLMLRAAGERSSDPGEPT